MKTVFGRIFIFITSTVILFSSVWALYDHLSFFLTRRETVAKVLNISDNKDDETFTVKVQYENDFTKKVQTTSVALKNSNQERLKRNDSKQIELFYIKGNPNKIYLIGYNTPRAFILVFDVVVIFLMIVGVCSAIKP